MAFKNRYLKNSPGRLYSFIGISKQVEYSDSASFAAFVTEAVDGEVGVFNANTGALISGAGAVGSTVEVFIAVKQGTSVNRSRTFTVGSAKSFRTPYVAPVKGASSIVLSGTPTVGKDAVVTILDLTPASHPQQSIEIRHTVKTGDTLDIIGASLAAKINDTTSLVAKSRDQIATATYTAGTDTLLITAKENGMVIKVLLNEDAAAWAQTVTKTVMGSGTPEEVALFEEQMLIASGVTTNYPNEGTTPEDWKKPASMIVAGAQYNYYNFKVNFTDSAKFVDKVQTWPDDLMLIVAANGAANAEAEIKLIFGL